MEKKTFYEIPEVELLRFTSAQRISASEDILVDDGSKAPDLVIPLP